MRGTLRMPNAIVTTSKFRSGNGSDSALASTKVTAASRPRLPARARPTASISPLMSATVAVVPKPPPAATAIAMSPVPPATSSSANGRSPRGAFTVLTSTSFHTRCRPADITSFIRS